MVFVFVLYFVLVICIKNLFYVKMLMNINQYFNSQKAQKSDKTVKDIVPNTLDDENVLVSNLQLAILKLNPQHFF